MKRAAHLAVSRYGADAAEVEKVFETVAKNEGRTRDLIEKLTAQKLLSPSQAVELRADLEQGAAPVSAAPMRPATPPEETDGDARGGQTGTGKVPPTRSGYYLRELGGFRLLRRLGEGGMGTVYLAYQEGQERQVAIKALADQLANNRAFVARFHREAKNGILLDHPNVVHCIDAGKDQTSGKHFLVMEYVEGSSARALLDRFGRLSVGDAVHIALDIARALEYVHARNFVHRDIKPDNILITQTGVAKLADLGLAKCLGEASSLTTKHHNFGTPYYMPCEQAMDATHADGRCDIYALGATLYHLLTGAVPFPGETHVQVAEKKLTGVFANAGSLNPAVPTELDRVLTKMLARDPADRYQTAGELIADLEHTRLDVPVPSFVDRDLALEDPIVQARNASSQPTRPDLETPPQKIGKNNVDPEAWSLRYLEPNGQWCKSRATTEQVLQRLRAGQIPATVEVRRQPDGEYQLVSAVAEFQEALVRNQLPAAAGPSPREEHSPSMGAEQLSTHAVESRKWSKKVLVLLGLIVVAIVMAVVFWLQV